ncbi:MAG: ATP-binding cassette domain-containing protein [Verrucomicrobia bacterium]|nr:ATP-binding cassette domain-containing protein [Verrucomicrobiota bacterium]
MNPFALETEAISFAYPDGFVALREIVFRVKRGEFVAMLASNGSGKTTLIKVLAGLLVPQSGSVKVDGRAIGEYSQAGLYQRLGLVFQNPNDQLFGATVAEDVAFGPRNLGLPEAEVQCRVAEALSAVGAGELQDRAIHHLSFGQQKRVAIAGVLAMKPAILILDEPTAGLDPAGEHSMLRLLSSLNREQGITIVLATHSVDTLPLFADRIYLLNRGRVLKEGPSEEVFRDHELIESASLRLPYVSRLLHELKRFHGVPIEGLPLTLGEAREQLLKLIPDEVILPVIEEGRL